MEKESYHHGALREELIQKGMELIQEEGVEKFSLRRVATLCNVSHAAPYKHFKSKEELIEAIIQYVLNDFSAEIRRVAKENPGPRCVLEVGKCYVKYMLAHKDYFQFMFQSVIKEKVIIEDGKFIYDERHPFGVFCEVANEQLKEVIPDEKQRNDMIFHHWCEVHGMAHLLLSEIVEYKGDYDSFIEEILSISNKTKC